jgi:Uma2 family endonuclease
MEVADSSLAYDLREKCQLYAEAGIRDYWVIDIPKRFAHIYCDPSARGYQTHRRLPANEQITPLLIANISLQVAGMFACLDESP